VAAGQEPKHPDFSDFRCVVDAYWWKHSFELVKTGDQYSLSSNMALREGDLIDGKFNMQIPSSSCQVDAGAGRLGVIKCKHDGGFVISKNKIWNFESFSFESRYETEVNDYPSWADRWPVWHQRIIEVEFRGGDFAVPHRVGAHINVNFHNGPTGERCTLDGAIIPE
jgi:hypothetical protein